MFLASKPWPRTSRNLNCFEIYLELQRVACVQTARPVFPEDRRRFEEDASYEDHEIRWQRVVNVVMASDSIVIYAAGDSYQDALAMGAAVRGLIVAGFRDGIALRGAITIGELNEIHLEDNTSMDKTGQWDSQGSLG
jgi:hypothetical protein